MKCGIEVCNFNERVKLNLETNKIVGLKLGINKIVS